MLDGYVGYSLTVVVFAYEVLVVLGGFVDNGVLTKYFAAYVLFFILFVVVAFSLHIFYLTGLVGGFFLCSVSEAIWRLVVTSIIQADQKQLGSC